MLSFFEPVIQTILALLKKQIETVDKVHQRNTVKVLDVKLGAKSPTKLKCSASFWSVDSEIRRILITGYENGARSQE